MDLPECQHRRYTNVPGTFKLHCFLQRRDCSEQECASCDYASPEGGDLVELERCDGTIETGRFYVGSDPTTEQFKHNRTEWTPEQPSRGLGDTIAKVTHATGIDKAVKVVTTILRIPCGCKQRQEALNKLVPYKEH